MSYSFKIIQGDNSFPPPVHLGAEPPVMSDDRDIWEQTDIRQFIAKMNVRIFIKAGTDPTKQNITEPEKMFYVCSEILSWVRQHGICAVLMTATYKWTKEVREKAFCAIGADKMSDFFEKLISVFRQLPSETALDLVFMSSEEYEHFLTLGESNETAACVNTLQREFPALEAETEALLYRYAHENKDSFDC